MTDVERTILECLPGPGEEGITLPRFLNRCARRGVSGARFDQGRIDALYSGMIECPSDGYFRLAAKGTEMLKAVAA